MPAPSTAGWEKAAGAAVNKQEKTDKRIAVCLKSLFIGDIPFIFNPPEIAIMPV
jgi:hypothetical protein